MDGLAFDESSHTYTLDGVVVPSVTQVIGTLCGIDTRFFTEASRRRGTAVHLACEYDDNGVLDESSVADDLRGYLVAWRRFRRESGLRPTKIELPVASRRHMFAGTIDRIMEDCDGVEYIVDIKSGVVSQTAALQTAGYAIAYCEIYGVMCDDRLVVKVDKTGGYKVHRFSDERDFGDFLAFRRVLAWREKWQTQS